MKMNKKLLLIQIFQVICFILILTSCGQPSDKVTYDETPTRGNIKIGVDQSYQPILDTEIATFESLYEYAIVNPLYKPENELFSDFFNDSVRIIITSRKLTKGEEDGLISHQIIPKTTRIAYDALTFIINKENPDSLFLYAQIRDIFKGKISNWKQINPKSKLDSIIVVFDNIESSNVRMLNEKFNLGAKFPSYCQAVNQNDEVINYVEKHKNAIGVISVNWISDKDDSLSLNFLDRINVVAVASELDANGDDLSYRPYQGYIAEGTYPFIREVYCINREWFRGLGTGFVSWIAGEKGQRIILKSGLVPSTMPIRLVSVKTK
jgi:phosphate transport system substrate-binding protein